MSINEISFATFAKEISLIDMWMSNDNKNLLKITFFVLNLTLVIQKKLSATGVDYPISRIEHLNKDISSVHRYVSRAKLLLHLLQ